MICYFLVTDLSILDAYDLCNSSPPKVYMLCSISTRITFIWEKTFTSIIIFFFWGGGVVRGVSIEEMFLDSGEEPKMEKKAINVDFEELVRIVEGLSHLIQIFSCNYLY